MKPTLPTLLRFAVLWTSLSTLVAANPPGQSGSNQNRARRPAEDGPNIEVLLASAVTAADSHSSIAAKIRQRIELFGHKLDGSGYYFQQGKGNQRRFRLELKVRVAEGISSFEQVCTGSDLWSREDLLSHTTLERIDLIRVRAVTEGNPRARARPSTDTALPPGGLPTLLANLVESFQFLSISQAQLDQRAVWRLEGEWKPAVLAELLPDQKQRLTSGQGADWSRIAPQLPRRVVLMLGQDDLFPYRIEYLRESSGSGQKSKPGPLRPIVALEPFEVQFGIPIEPKKFVYMPGNRPFNDQTETYLKKLGVGGEPSQDAQRLRQPPGGIQR